MVGFQMWSTVVFVVMLAEVQKLSLVQAWLSGLAPGTVVMIIVAVSYLT